MILYQALSSYQILECMVHKQCFFPEEKGVLILGNYITERMPQYRELETRGFFDEVYLFRFGGYKGSEEEIVKQVGEELSKTLPYELFRFDRRIMAGIHTYLQVYMIHQGITFEMFEDGSGALSRPWILADIHKKSAPGRYEVIERNHLYDHTSPWITRKYCDMKSQEQGFEDEKAEDFQILEQFQQLSRQQQLAVREVFRVPSLRSKPDGVLLLTQQFANLGQLTFEEQVLIYENLMDYYLEGKKLMIKPHPDDMLYYDQLFPGAEVIREKFPSELLPIAFEKMPGKLCTISSTGVNLIAGEFSETLFFNPLYEKTFHFNHLYYMALVLARKLEMPDLLLLGVNQVQMENLIKSRKDWEDFFNLLPESAHDFLVKEKTAGNKKRNIFCIADDWEDWGETGKRIRQGARDGRLQGLCCLNTRKQYQMYTPEEKSWFFQLLPVSVVKKQVSDREYYDRETENTLFFYSREERWMHMAEKTEYSKILPCTGTRISLENMTKDQMKIKMLEGILEATERRLLEYIQLEKELEQELKKYKTGQEGL